jgi:hypothetical protein
MQRFEHRVCRLRVNNDGGNYSLMVNLHKKKWEKIDDLGKDGWEFVAFMPTDTLDTSIDLNRKGKRQGNAILHVGILKREMDGNHDLTRSAPPPALRVGKSAA